MTSKIIYIVLFLGAFILTTIIIAFFNSQFNNIFQFDFSPPTEVLSADIPLSLDDSLHLSAAKNTVQDALNIFNEDELTAVENTGKDALNIFNENELKNNVIENNRLRDSLDILKSELEQIKKDEVKIEEQPKKNNDNTNSNSNKNDYKAWLKQTSDLYAAMDSKKAAKIIQNYSDNIARDLLYTMNKKKAAQILGELKPEVATRIMRVN